MRWVMCQNIATDGAPARPPRKEVEPGKSKRYSKLSERYSKN
jgi:hypothetical protein